MKNYQLIQLEDLETVQCPCGLTRRAFQTESGGLASIHLLDIKQDARTHYHRRLTEIYVILEGGGQLELDGELVPVQPLTAIMIKPGCRHRALGKLRVLNIVIPSFDPTDEWFD